MCQIKTVRITMYVVAVFGVCHAVSADVITPTMPAYSWLFDEGSGTTTAAYTGGNDGTLAANAAWSPSTPFGYAGDHSVNVAAGEVTAPSQNLGPAGTLSMWLNAATASGTFMMPIDRETPRTYVSYNGTTFYVSAPGGAGGGYLYTSLSANTWYNYVVTWDNAAVGGIGCIQQYLNGSRIACGTGVLFNDTGTTTAWHFGSHYKSLAPWNGLIDEFGFWNTALSDSEVGWVATHSLASIGVPEPTSSVLLASCVLGLVCYAWRKRK